MSSKISRVFVRIENLRTEKLFQKFYDFIGTKNAHDVGEGINFKYHHVLPRRMEGSNFF